MPDSEAPEAKIEKKYEEIQGADYYEVLGVERGADEDTIRNRFRKLAKKWHADRYSGEDLSAETRKKLQAIFAEINNARRTLSNPNDRQEYDAALETGDADLESVIDAENAFRRGRNMLDAGRYEGAHAKFQEACELSPEDEPDYRAHRLYTEFLQIPKDEDGNPKAQRRAKEIFEELDEISQNTTNQKDWLFAFMGVVAQGMGRQREAESLFNEATVINPDNTMAQRQLRLIKRRRKKEKDKGFFEKLISKFTS